MKASVDVRRMRAQGGCIRDHGIETWAARRAALFRVRFPDAGPRHPVERCWSSAAVVPWTGFGPISGLHPIPSGVPPAEPADIAAEGLEALMDRGPGGNSSGAGRLRLPIPPLPRRARLPIRKRPRRGRRGRRGATRKGRSGRRLLPHPDAPATGPGMERHADGQGSCPVDGVVRYVLPLAVHRSLLDRRAATFAKLCPRLKGNSNRSFRHAERTVALTAAARRPSLPCRPPPRSAHAGCRSPGCSADPRRPGIRDLCDRGRPSRRRRRMPPTDRGSRRRSC